MFGLIKKFDRAAVLTDKTWFKKVSELEGVFFPGLEIKAYDRDQKAEAWLSSWVYVCDAWSKDEDLFIGES